MDVGVIQAQLVKIQSLLSALAGRKNCLLMLLLLAATLLSFRLRVRESNESDDEEYGDPIHETRPPTEMNSRAVQIARDEPKFLLYLQRLDRDLPDADPDIRSLAFYRAHKRTVRVDPSLPPHPSYIARQRSHKSTQTDFS